MAKIKKRIGEKVPDTEESVSTEIQKIATGEIREYRGLCWACKGNSTCTYRRDPLQPVLGCDEFECETLPENISPPTGSPFKPDDPYESAGTYKGLCVNCERRETCTYPKPEGGVWHCEEYE